MLNSNNLHVSVSEDAHRNLNNVAKDVGHSWEVSCPDEPLHVRICIGIKWPRNVIVWYNYWWILILIIFVILIVRIGLRIRLRFGPRLWLLAIPVPQRVIAISVLARVRTVHLIVGNTELRFLVRVRWYFKSAALDWILLTLRYTLDLGTPAVAPATSEVRVHTLELLHLCIDRNHTADCS